MSDSAFKLQLLVRAELALTRIYARRSLFRAAAIAVALGFLLVGLGMLNFAAYLGLLDKYTPDPQDPHLLRAITASRTNAGHSS